MGDEADDDSFLFFLMIHLGMGFYHTRTNCFHRLKHLCFCVAFFTVKSVTLDGKAKAKVLLFEGC